jgi:hypothetical protein
MGEPRRYKYTGEATDPGTGHGVSASKNYLSGKDAKAIDYNQTRANIQTERTRKSQKNAQGKEVALIHDLPGEVIAGRSKIEAAQINNLRKATTGLVNYNGSATFPWSETITASATKLKAKHLEEVRQVVDDSKNNARCGDSCSSGCARNCSVACANETCKGACGMLCKGGCGAACQTNCAQSCSATNQAALIGCKGCGNSCVGDCVSCSGCSGCTDCSGCSGWIW